jgi:hypothetical protein
LTVERRGFSVDRRCSPLTRVSRRLLRLEAAVRCAQLPPLRSKIVPDERGSNSRCTASEIGASRAGCFGGTTPTGVCSRHGLIVVVRRDTVGVRISCHV